jgi:hypothetical protein
MARRVRPERHVRLALHVERGGELFVAVGDTLFPVLVEPDGRFLHTRGAPGTGIDPILQLPTYY